MRLQREQGEDVSRKKKFKLLALTEAKMKRNGHMSWCGVVICLET